MDTQGASESWIAEWKKLAERSSLRNVRGLVGVEGSRIKVFTGRDGSFAVDSHAFQVGFLMVDLTHRRLYTPETIDTEWSLENGRLPISVVRWCVDDLEVVTRTFAHEPIDNTTMMTFARTSVRNLGTRDREVQLFITFKPCPLAVDRGGKCLRISHAQQGLVLVDSASIQIRCEGEPVPEADGLKSLGLNVLAPGALVMDGEGHTSAAVGFSWILKMGEEKQCEVTVPAGAVQPDQLESLSLVYDAELDRVRTYWQKRVPIHLRLPDKRYEDFFYSSLNTMLLLMSGSELWPGPYNYRNFFLHDGVDMVEALDKAGLHDVARRSLVHFEYRKEDRYLDGIGGVAFALYHHGLMTRDMAFLRDVYPRILRSCELLRDMRRQNDAESNGVEEIKGLLPLSSSHDNFNKPAHLYLDNWWGCIGLKAGAEAAALLGNVMDASWMRAEYEDLLACSLSSLQAVMKRDGLGYAPSLADNWPMNERVVDGDHRVFGDTQMAWAHRPLWAPGRSLGIEAPVELFTKSYRYYWNRAGAFSGFDGGWFVEYEKVFWGYNVMLARPLLYMGMGDVALQNIKWSVEHPSCPGGWMEAMPSSPDAIGLQRIADGIIGDVPHGWVAAHYVLLLREMLVREEGDRLVLLTCVPSEWLEDGKVIELSNAPTLHGVFDLKVVSLRSQGLIVVELHSSQVPSRGYRLKLPDHQNVHQVDVDGIVHAQKPGEYVDLPLGTHRVEIRYR